MHGLPRLDPNGRSAEQFEDLEAPVLREARRELRPGQNLEDFLVDRLGQNDCAPCPCQRQSAAGGSISVQRGGDNSVCIEHVEAQDRRSAL
jgi:hypothetical protein